MNILVENLLKLQEELIKEDAIIKELSAAVDKAERYKERYELNGKIHFYDILGALSEHRNNRNDIEQKIEFIREMIGEKPINPRGTKEYKEVVKFIDNKFAKFAGLIMSKEIVEKENW